MSRKDKIVVKSAARAPEHQQQTQHDIERQTAKPPAGVRRATTVTSANTVEQADVVAGMAGTGTGVVALARYGPTRVQFSLVNGQAIFEGDIDLGTPAELEVAEKALAALAGEMQAAVVADTSKRWTQGRVPYELVPDSSPLRATVAAALDEINFRTPVRMVPRELPDRDFVAFEVAAFCSSQVGRSGGRQVVRLSPDCTVGNAVHELCHVLGLWHEQSRKDRDSYIRVRWENILSGYEHNFRQQLADEDDIGPYDFGSIMHYPPNAFTSNGQATLEPLAGNPPFGQRDGLSDGDIAAISYMYAPSTGSGAGVLTGAAVSTGPIGSIVSTSPTSAGSFVVPAIGGGVQFRVMIPAHEIARVVTRGWPALTIVHWDIICADGPTGAGPLLSWTYEVGRSPGNTLDYFFTITNLSNETVTAEARYVNVPHQE